MNKAPKRYGPARMPESEARIEAQVAAHLEGLDQHAKQTLLFALRSSAMLGYEMGSAAASETQRKRAFASFQTNARRMLESLASLDDEALDFAAGIVAGAVMDGGHPDTRHAELRGLGDLAHMRKCLERLCESTAKIPPHPFRYRPEFLIACDVRKALQDADIHVAAADTGAAADCFRVVAELAEVETSDSPRYWIQKAIDHPEI